MAGSRWNFGALRYLFRGTMIGMAPPPGEPSAAQIEVGQAAIAKLLEAEGVTG